jgi:hypothetical protein
VEILGGDTVQAEDLYGVEVSRRWVGDGGSAKFWLSVLIERRIACPCGHKYGNVLHR